MADGRRGGGQGAVGAAGGMVSDAVMSVAERIVRPSAAADREPAPPAVTRRPAQPARLPARYGPRRAIRAAGDAATVVAGRIAPAMIERVDVDAIVQRIDVNRMLARVDADAVLDRVDPNPLIERVDVDRLVDRIDMGPVAREAIEGLDIGEIVRESTAGLGGDVIRDARLQAMRADRGVERAADRALGREPRGAVIPAPGGATSCAGLVSRTIATLIDTLVVVLCGLVLLVVVASVRLLWVGGFDIGFVDAIPLRVGAVLLLLAYLTYGWGLDGRTVGKLLLGLRVLDDDGSDLSYRRAFVRAVLAIAFPVGLLWAAVSRRSASVQDLIVSTAVVHDWGRERTPERPSRRGEVPGGAAAP